jgi:hypothetical protein
VRVSSAQVMVLRKTIAFSSPKFNLPKFKLLNGRGDRA